MILNKYDEKILQIILENGQVDLDTIKKKFWEGLSEDEVYHVNLGDNVTKLYLAEYIRKAQSYGGYALTRKGKRYITEEVEA